MNIEARKQLAEIVAEEVDSEVPKFDTERPIPEKVVPPNGYDFEIPEFTDYEAEMSSDQGCDDAVSEEVSDENAETSGGETREGYESWDDVPHTTDPETGRERYELQSGKDAESLNSVPPPANADIYVKDADGRNYIKDETDDKGRIIKISRPRIELAEHSQRTNETLQTVDKKDGRRDDEGNKLDDGGHLVADEFGGSSEQTNLVPMDSEVNRHGEWRKMERDIEKELSKEPPSEVKDFEVEIEYDDDSARPSGFTVSYTLDDGGSTKEITKYINNERTESEDLRNAA